MQSPKRTKRTKKEVTNRLKNLQRIKIGKNGPRKLVESFLDDHTEPYSIRVNDVSYLSD